MTKSTVFAFVFAVAAFLFGCGGSDESLDHTNPDPSGNAGTAGGAGSGGSAGQSGQAGAGGQVGVAGQAGSSGAGASAGAAGAGGQAGEAGSSGSGGSSGTGGQAGAAGQAGSGGDAGSSGSGGTAGAAGQAGAAGAAGAAGTGGSGGSANQCLSNDDCSKFDTECLTFWCGGNGSCFVKERDTDGDNHSLCGGLPDGQHYDCNDADPNVYPGAIEVCGNGVDDNCDGTIDEGCSGVAIKLSTTTPQTAIVVGGKDSWRPYTEYDVVGPDWLFERTDVYQNDGNGDWHDFTSVALAANGQVLVECMGDQSFNRWICEPVTPISIQSGTKLQVWGKMASVVSSAAAGGAYHGVARSGHTPSLKMTHAKGIWGGAELDVKVEEHTPNFMVLRKSKPTFTSMPTSSPMLGNYDMDLYKFLVSADTAGPIALKQLVFHLQKSGADYAMDNLRMRKGAADMDPQSYTLYSNAGTAYPGAPDFPLGLTESVIIVTFTSEEYITGSGAVYTLHGTGMGVGMGSSLVTDLVPLTYGAGDVTMTGSLVQIGTPIPGPFLGVGTTGLSQRLVWSDVSEVPHSFALGSAGSIDWTNGYLVEGSFNAQVLQVP